MLLPPGTIAPQNYYNSDVFRLSALRVGGRCAWAGSPSSLSIRTSARLLTRATNLLSDICASADLHTRYEAVQKNRPTNKFDAAQDSPLASGMALNITMIPTMIVIQQIMAPKHAPVLSSLVTAIATAPRHGRKSTRSPHPV